MLLLAMIVLIVAAVAALVVAPILAPRGGDSANDGQVAALEARKEAKYREIRDAELDYRTGKLSEDDFRELDRELRREAVAILSEIDGLTQEPKITD